MINKKVGDTVYYVPNDLRYYRTRGEIEITKVGGEYMYAGDMRFVPWNYDGYAIGTSPDNNCGHIYESRSDYEEMLAWSGVSDRLEQLNREQRKEVMSLVRSMLG